jgi:predicted acetyltransferase
VDDVSLDQATHSDAPLLSNLLELYIHDLSDMFPVELGPDGRFGYDRLSLYWSEPERRWAFLIRRRGRVVGFVLATRAASPVTGADAHDVAEFFVLRRYRRSNVGRRAAFLLWNRLPGAWTVRVAETNTGALAFWRDVIAEYTSGAASESMLAGKLIDWRVLSFESVSCA